LAKKGGTNSADPNAAHPGAGLPFTYTPIAGRHATTGLLSFVHQVILAFERRVHAGRREDCPACKCPSLLNICPRCTSHPTLIPLRGLTLERAIFATYGNNDTAVMAHSPLRH